MVLLPVVHRVKGRPAGHGVLRMTKENMRTQAVLPDRKLLRVLDRWRAQSADDRHVRAGENRLGLGGLTSRARSEEVRALGEYLDGGALLVDVHGKAARVAAKPARVRRVLNLKKKNNCQRHGLNRSEAAYQNAMGWDFLLYPTLSTQEMSGIVVKPLLPRNRLQTLPAWTNGFVDWWPVVLNKKARADHT
jgi:hypothetical protein